MEARGPRPGPRFQDEGLGGALEVAGGVATTIVYGLTFFGKCHGFGWMDVGKIFERGDF